MFEQRVDRDAETRGIGFVSGDGDGFLLQSISSVVRRKFRCLSCDPVGAGAPPAAACPYRGLDGIVSQTIYPRHSRDLGVYLELTRSCHRSRQHHRHLGLASGL